MSVRITNAVVQAGNVTTVSAQLVVAGGLSYNARLDAFSTLVSHAAASLELPHEGPMAAELLYRVADERAGAATLPIAEPHSEQRIEAQPGPTVRPAAWKVALFWAGLLLLIAAAFLAQRAV